MPDIPTPTARELEILKVLWELGPSSVRVSSARAWALWVLRITVIRRIPLRLEEVTRQ